MPARYIHNAHFYIDGSFANQVRGLLVENGKIARLLQTGDGIDPAWEKTDLQGSWAYPGFIDAHTHSFSGGLYEDGVDLAGCASIEEVLSLLSAAARQQRELLIGWRFDEGRIREKRFPSVKELDSVCPDARLLLRRVDGHSCVLNSLAREAIPGLGGRDEVLIAQDNDLAVNWLQDNCSEETILAAYHSAARTALRGGFTAIHTMIGDAQMSVQHYQLIRDRRAEFPVRFELYPQSFDVDAALELGAKRIGGCILADGSIGSRTAALDKPYADSATKGRLYQSDGFWADFVSRAHQNGLQVCVHCIGDAAIRQLNRAYALHPSSEVRELRHQLIHCEVTPDGLISGIAASGAVPVMQPAFDLLWGGDSGLYAQRLGERWQSMNRFRTLARKGIRVCGSSDWYVTDLNIAMSLHALIHHHNPDERLTPAEAIKVYTENNAWLNHEENLRGRIAEGMQADLSAMDTDFTRPFDWRACRSNFIIRAGELVYASDKA
ncbi:MAG: amidohydrolase family protein [Candidatus Cloacimonetes bacterium]|nr:amidohydrolase family protein [Candidatus Cloacimonadota bacterium]